MTVDAWQALAAVVAGAGECAMVVDDQGRIVEWNPAAEETFAIGRARAIGDELVRLTVPPEGRAAFAAELQRTDARPGSPVHEVDLVAQRASGERFAARARLTRLELGGRRGWCCWLRDLTDRGTTSSRQQHLRAVLEQADMLLFALDRDGVLTLLEGAEEIVGKVGGGELLGRPVGELLAGDPDALESVARAGAGETVTLDVGFGDLVWQTRYGPLFDADDQIAGVVGVATDVTLDRRVRREAADRALIDPLTGALSRQGLEAEFEAAGFAPRCAVLHVGIENFDLITASLGRAAGDQLLDSAYRRLRETLGDGAPIARPGGHHFTIVLPGAGESGAIAVGERALEALSGYFDVEGARFRAETSVGIAHDGGEGHDAEELVQRSERAFARARRLCPGNVLMYDEQGADPHEQLRMTARLQQAISAGDLRLFYQPIFRLDVNVPRAVEALVRWDDPDEGLIPPMRFIPLAEVTGLIEEVGDWVISELCRQAAAWRDVGVAPHLHFNAAPSELRRPGYAQNVLEHITVAGLPATQFTIEVTESAAMEHADRTWPVLEELRAAGMRIAIDDFGAGHSSLARLSELPVNVLKIDRQFLAGVPSDRDAAALLTSILSLAEGLRLTAVAEGIETDRQLEFLVGRRCPLGQGFLLTRPAAAAGMGVLADPDGT